MIRKYVDTFSQNYEKVNDEFVKCTIAVLSCDQIANGTKFTVDGVNNASSTLDYAPLIGYFNGEDFEGHGQEMVWTDNGIEFKVKTIPFGVAIKGTQRWENIQKPNGETEQYFCVDAYMWSRYQEATQKVMENKCNQSMEVKVISGQYQKDYYEIDEFAFEALCILGEDVQPAFNLAKVRTSDKFEKNEFKAEYSEMVQALDNYLQYEDGGESVKDKEKDKEKDKTDGEFADKGKDTKDAKDKKDDMHDGEDKKDKMKCADQSNCKDCSDAEKCQGCCCNGCNSDCNGCDKSPNCDSMKPQSSNMSKDNEDKEEFEAKYNELNAKYSTTLEENSKIKDDYTKLEANYSTLEAEIVELRNYKDNNEKAVRMQKEEELFAQFEEIAENEEFVALKGESANYSLDELETRCFALLGKIQFSKKNTKSTKKAEKTAVFSAVDTGNVYNEPVKGKYDDLISQYKDKK